MPNTDDARTRFVSRIQDSPVCEVLSKSVQTAIDFTARRAFGAREMSDDLSASNAAEAAREARAIREEMRLLREDVRILQQEIRTLRETLEVYSAIAESIRDSRLTLAGWL